MNNPIAGWQGDASRANYFVLQEQNELIYVAIGNGDIALKIATRLEIGQRSTISGEPLSSTVRASEVPHGTQHHVVIVKTDNR